MPGHLRHWLAAAAAAGLLTAGLSTTATHAAATPASRATGETFQPGPFEVGNLLDYANSDFEGTTGNWVAADSKTNLTDDTSHSFLHDDSLLITVPAGGTGSLRISPVPDPIDITVTPGATYRVGAYFKTSGTQPETVQFTLNCYDASGHEIGAPSGAANALKAITNWQYSEDQITVPGGCAYVQGSPKVTLSNLPTDAAVNMDEVIFAPERAALIIGAHGQEGIDGKGGYTATDWIDTNSTIGPLQSDKQFYGGNSPALPGQWNDPGNNCYELERAISNHADWPACVINLNPGNDLTSPANAVYSEKQILALFTGNPVTASLPADQMVIMLYKGEPELSTYSGCPGAAPGNAANYVCYFELESGYVRQAAKAVGDVPNVFLAAGAATSAYGNPGCAWIPPTGYVDFYLADHYDDNASGNSLPNESGSNGQKWANWLSCVQPIDKPLGLSEYGLDCHSNPDQPVVTQQMAADDSYLAAIPGATEPTILWEYWYSDDSTPGCVFDNTGIYKGVGGITQWQNGETQNGGG